MSEYETFERYAMAIEEAHDLTRTLRLLIEQLQQQAAGSPGGIVLTAVEVQKIQKHVAEISGRLVVALAAMKQYTAAYKQLALRNARSTWSVN